LDKTFTQSWWLTTGTDAPVGTSGNDTFNGAEVTYTDAATAVASGSYGILDSVSGSTGTDTLNIVVQGGGATYTTAALPGATVSGIEVINVRSVQAQAADIVTLAAGTTPGLTAFNTDRSTSAVTVTGLASGATAGMITSSGAFSAGWGATVTAATLNAGSGTTGGLVTLTGASVATTTVNSTGAANTLGGLTIAATSTALNIAATTGLTTGAITGAALTTITVTGAAATGTTAAAANVINAAVKLGTAPATVTSIDASGMTAGGVDITLVAAVNSFKGGAGSDVVTTATLTNTAASIIDGGAGTDVLVLAAYADANTAAKAKQFANFETVDSGALGGAALDMSLFTNSTVTGLATGVATAASFSNVTAAQALNVTIYGSQTTTTTIAVKDATVNGNLDTLTLNFNDGLTAKSTFVMDSLVAAGVETLNVVATDHATIALLTGSTSITAINVTGAGDTSITTGAVAANANTVVNASALTGTFAFIATGATANGYKVTGSATKANTLTGAALNDILIGGAANDTITAGAGANTLTGGGGADSFVLAAQGAGGGVPSATAFNTITDFSKVAGLTTFDTISSAALILGAQTAAAGAGVATITAGVATFNAADTTFAAHLAAVAAALQTTAGATAVWQEGADSYLYIADATLAVANTDILVKLTGVTAGALTVAANAITAMA
jgi:hypothetical protein